MSKIEDHCGHFGTLGTGPVNILIACFFTVVTRTKSITMVELYHTTARGASVVEGLGEGAKMEPRGHTHLHRRRGVFSGWFWVLERQEVFIPIVLKN